MKKPKVSVIIPVYNAEMFLKRAIDSVLISSIDELEILVIDDASPGGCRSIIENDYKKDVRVKYIRHEKNLGLFAARRTGIDHAKGEYLVHLDPDDWIVNDIYHNAYDQAVEKNLDVVMFNVIQEDENGYRWIEKENILEQSNSYSAEKILDNIFYAQSKAWIWHVSWNKLIKTDRLKEISEHFSQTDHLNMYEDLLWSITLFSHIYKGSKVGILEQIGLVYYRHGKSITKSIEYSAYVKKYNDLQFVSHKISKILKFYNIYARYEKDLKKLFCHINSIYSPWNQTAKDRLDKLKLWGLRIAHTFTTFTCEKNSDLSESVEVLEKKVQELLCQAVAIFGTGEFALKLKQQLEKKGIIVSFFISTDKQIIGTKLDDLDVVDIDDTMNQNQIKCICIASIGSHESIVEMLRSKQDGKEVFYITI